MSSGRKIILHTGFHKTGTSSIQNVLHENRDSLLEREGVLYPSLAPNLSVPLLTIFKETPGNLMVNARVDSTAEEMAARRKNYLASLEAEISSREWDTLLLSAEGVSFLSASELAKLREWGEKYASDWIVLTCVRHPVGWTRSVLQERLKQGDTLQQLYGKLPTTKYREKTSGAISVFGRENVRVFDFDAATKSDDGIVGTFADQVGLTPPSRDLLVSRAVRVNESLSLEAVRILDSLNRQRPMFVGNGKAPRRAGPGRELAYLRRIEGQKFDVPGWVKENIRLQSREDVAWLNETFGLGLYRDVEDPIPATESSEEPVETLGDETVDSIAAVIGDLVVASVFQRVLNQGRVALGRDDFEQAEKMLRKAARLDPDAPQPKKLLEQVTRKQRANTEKSSLQEKTDKSAKRASFLDRFRR